MADSFLLSREEFGQTSLSNYFKVVGVCGEIRCSEALLGSREKERPGITKTQSIGPCVIWKQTSKASGLSPRGPQMYHRGETNDTIRK